MPALRNIALLALAATASAQLSSVTSSLSSGCQSAATSLISSEFASCASLLSLVSVVTTSGSIISPLETWLNSACTSTCNSSAIDAAVKIVDDGCSSDLADGNTIVTALKYAITNYDTEQKALCLQSTSNSTYCISQLLTSVQSATGTDLSVTDIQSIYSNTTILSQLTPAELCTDCNHGLVSAFSSLDNGTLTSFASSECGSSFADGQTPSTVALKSGNGTSSSTESTPLSGAGRVGAGAMVAGVVAVAFGALSLM
ncbi:hypothetical protein BCR35DRAFT_300364 [Leucosporidium creatinivorum]|uniref:DUF7729 domain-containing protein n=1 Tax=Leucosporidium creatinivorum TaxID=106004 RepID=A0A1Y2FYQ3_9BASI|nr:hypothetical protein BCR35DRAFT_300364 [Leucosporidium creatinivorum]